MATTPTPPYDPNPEVPAEPTLSRKVSSAAEEFRDIKSLLQRCLKVPAGEALATLPGAHARKSGLLGFDASTGQPIIINVDGDLIGVPGPQGAQGIPGVSQYFHIAYANSADGSVGFNQVDGAYIGTYVDGVEEDSTNPAAYAWKLFSGQQGPQGIPGINGANGQTSYFHIKYSNDGGLSFTANDGETVGSWIGTYVDFTSADSSLLSAYTWKKIEGGVGPQGPQGTPGASGANGQTSYFHVAYANSADGSVGFNQNSGTYIGTYVDFTSTDSTDRTMYAWKLFQGAQGQQGLQGIPGLNGATGATTYLHIKYSNDGGTNFTANTGETPGAYMGVYTDTNINDSASPNAYTWTKIQGEQGGQGNPGSAGARGSVDAWANTGGTSWSDSEANSAVAAAGYESPVNLDKVTLVNTAAGYVETRYRAGADWITFSQVFNGNLIVNGTIAGYKLAVDSIETRHLKVGSVSALLSLTYSSGAMSPIGTNPGGQYVELVFPAIPAQDGEFPMLVDVQGTIQITVPAGSGVTRIYAVPSFQGIGASFASRGVFLPQIEPNVFYANIKFSGVAVSKTVAQDYVILVETASKNSSLQNVALPSQSVVVVDVEVIASVNKV